MTICEPSAVVVVSVCPTGYIRCIGGKRLHRHSPAMTTAAYSRFSPAIPAGVEFSISTNAYWVRADYALIRRGRTWILEDQDTLEERRFRTEAAGLAALAALV